MSLTFMSCAGTWISTTVESSNYEVRAFSITRSHQSGASVPSSEGKLAAMQTI